MLAYYIIRGRKKRVGPHISIATKSAVPPQQNIPPSPPPPPPHMTNGGVYRCHDSPDSYPAYPPAPTHPTYTVHQPAYGYNSGT